MKAKHYAEMLDSTPVPIVIDKLIEEMNDVWHFRGGSDLALLGVLKEFDNKWEAVNKIRQVPSYENFYIAISSRQNNIMPQFMKLIENFIAAKTQEKNKKKRKKHD